MNTSSFDRSDLSSEEGQPSRITRSMSRILREKAERNGEVNISTAFKLQNSNESLRARFPGYTNTATTKTKNTVSSKKYTREALISRQTQVNRLKYKPMVDGSSSEEDDIIESSFTSISSTVSASNSPLRQSPRIHKTPKRTPGIGQRLVSSIVTHTPQWIRGSFSTSRPNRSIYRDSPNTREIMDDEVNDDAPNTLYMMAGRYHLESGEKAGINLVRNSDGEIEIETESSEDSAGEVDVNSWKPGVTHFTQYRPAFKPQRTVPLAADFEEDTTILDDGDYDNKHYTELQQGPGLGDAISSFIFYLGQVLLKLFLWIQHGLCLCFTVIKNVLTSFDWGYPLRLALSGLITTVKASAHTFRILHRKLGSLAPLFYTILLLGFLWNGIGEQKRNGIYHQVGSTRDHLIDKAYDTRDVFVHKAFDARDQLASQVYMAKEGIVNQAHVAKEGIYSRAHSALNKFDEAKGNIYSRVQEVQHQVASQAFNARDRIVHKAQDTLEKGYQAIDRVKAKIPKPTDITSAPIKQDKPEKDDKQIIVDNRADEVITPEIPHSYVDSPEPVTASPLEEAADPQLTTIVPRVNWSAFSPSSFILAKLSWPKVNIPTISILHNLLSQLPELPFIDISKFSFEWFKAMISKVNPFSFELPEINLHRFLPKINWPPFDLAELNLPSLQLGKFEWPTFDLPKMSLRLPSLPELNLPKPKIPHFSLPTWSLSNLLPEISWPDFSRLNPFSSKPSPEHRSLPPKTLTEFHNRLSELEDSIRDLAVVASVLMDDSDNMAPPGSHTSQSREKLLHDLGQIRRTLNQELEALSGQNEVIQKLAGAITSREEELTAIERQVEGLGNEMNLVAKQVQEVDQNIVGVYSHVKQLNGELAHTSDWNNIKQQIITILERELPTHLIVQRKEDGSIVMSSEFYSRLTNLLLTKDQANQSINEEIENQKQHIPRHDHKTRWAEYFEENKHLLSQLIQEDLEEGVKHYTDKGVLVHKNDFLSIVEPHLEQLRLSLTAHVDMDITNVEKEMEKELEKTETDREERRQKYFKAVHLVKDMIQNSLAKHAADTIARPDFALYSSGARVVTKLTTPSYLHQAGSTLGKLAQVFGMNTPKNGNPPAMALDPDTHLGKCWAFPGSRGQLTIQLSRTINVTDFTIEHVDQQVAIDLRSAPKDIAVYGLIPRSSDKENENPEAFDEFLLGQYEFDIKGNRIQTFPVDSHGLYQPVRYVQLRVLSNHGHSDFTCIYRFRVHGKLSEV